MSSSSVSRPSGSQGRPERRRSHSSVNGSASTMISGWVIPEIHPGRAVAGLDLTVEPAHDGAVGPEPPPCLPGLEDGAGLRRPPPPPPTAVANASSRQRREDQGGHRAGERQRPPAARGQGAQHGQRRPAPPTPWWPWPRPAAAPAQPRAAGSRDQDRRDAQHGGQDLLGVAELQRAHHDWAGHAQAERGDARQASRAHGPHARRQPQGQRSGSEQAGEREHPVDGEVAAVPQSGEKRERRAQHQRAAVGGCGARKRPTWPSVRALTAAEASAS